MVKYFEKPVIKKAADMKAGDVFRTEFGDYGNFCNFVFESNQMTDDSTLETTYHSIGGSVSEKCYGFVKWDKAEYEVIGVETTD